MQSLDRELELFKKNYLLLEAFLTEAAQRLERIARKSYSVRETSKAVPSPRRIYYW